MGNNSECNGTPEKHDVGQMHRFTVITFILINKVTKIFGRYVDELLNASKSCRAGLDLDLIFVVQHALTLNVWLKHCQKGNRKAEFCDSNKRENE